MIKIPQLLSQLMEAFQKANPKVIVRTPFTPHQNHLLKVLIKKYKETQSDLWLGKLAKLYLKFLSDGDDKAYMKARKLVAKTPSITPLVRNNILDKESKLVFKTPSVPGPARLCRVPFYPVRDENAWSSRFLEIDSASPSRQAFGIDELGDDPILAVGPWLSTSDTTSVGPYNMMTRKIEFGAYRLIGLEIAAHYGTRYIGAVVAGSDATGSITIDGAPTAATGTITASGPTAVSATADIVVGGTTSTSATATITIDGTASPATGSITVPSDGTAGTIDISFPGAETASTGQFGFLYSVGATTTAADDGIIGIPADGTGASVNMQFLNSGTPIVDGDTVTFPLVSSGTIITRTYTARTTPSGPLEFQASADCSVVAASFKSVLEADFIFASIPYFYVTILGSTPTVASFTVQASPFSSSTLLNGQAVTSSAPVTVVKVASFSGATNAGFDATESFTVEDTLGATTTFTFQDAAPLVANGIFTSTSNFVVAGRIATAVNALANFTASQTSLGVVTMAQTIQGSSGNTDITLVPDPNPLVITSSFSTGTDVIPDGCIFTLTDTSGVDHTLTATLNAPGANEFQVLSTSSIANFETSVTNYRNAVNALADFSASAPVFAGAVVRTGAFTVTQGTAGRNGDTAIGSTGISVGTNVTITDFTGGASKVSVDTTFTLTDTEGTSATFVGKDTVTSPSTQFLVGSDETATLTSIQSALVANAIKITLAGNTFTQTVLGSLGNTTPSTGGTDPTEITFSAATFTGGTDAGVDGDTVEVIDVDGTTATLRIISAGSTPGEDQIENTGYRDDLAQNTATQIDRYTNLDISTSVVGNVVTLTQDANGSAGNTTITEVGTSFTVANFTGGTDVFPQGQSFSITDGDSPTSSATFTATASSESATQFISNASQTETAVSLAKAIGLSTIRVNADYLGNVVTLTQQDSGTNGNNATPTKTGGTATISTFSGGTNTIGAGTITINNTIGPAANFVAGTDFTNVGTNNDVASSLATAITGSPNISATASGNTVTVSQNEVGTVGNVETLSSSVAEITAPATFSGGIDNISVAGYVDQFGNPTVATTVTVEDSFGVSQTFTAVRSGGGATDFTVSQVDPSQSMDNLRDQINAFAFDVSGISIGSTITLTQGTNGPDGNTTITTNEATELTVAGFSGGTYSVEIGSTITLTATDGTSATFTAVDGVPGADEYQVDPVVATTITNLNNAIVANGIAITGVAASPTLNLTQDVAGLGGNTSIVIGSDPSSTLSAVDFTGGTNNSVNLTSDLSPVSLSIRELTVYNGDNILVVEDSEAVSAGEFNILNRPETFQFEYEYPAGSAFVPTGQPAAPLSKFKRDASYKFIGLRDQPIVDPNTQVFVKVEGFLATLPTYQGAYPANTPAAKVPPISMSINLIVDLLEDKIFGDPIVPSPASRPAANIKLGKIDVGNNRIIVTNAQTKKPKI